ncbi:hypothetical protein LX36DRAFT_742683 [Colletotrichum falcatum]|nr:hypothetical protein LX36DRAFT_742683 [Colletotrichum falcatum]
MFCYNKCIELDVSSRSEEVSQAKFGVAHEAVPFSRLSHVPGQDQGALTFQPFHLGAHLIGHDYAEEAEIIHQRLVTSGNEDEATTVKGGRDIALTSAEAPGSAPCQLWELL